jgi:hypothetical protein
MAMQSLRASGSMRADWRVPAAGLLAAGAIVAVAIYVGGPAAQALNGVGGIVWLGSAVALIRALPHVPRATAGRVVALATAVAIAGWVRPATIPESVAAFTLAGAAVVLVAGDRVGAWGLLVPAIYLPAHLVIGIGRAIIRGGAMRTEPPPTPALVPLAMIVAALVGGMAAAALARRVTGKRFARGI